MYSRRPMPDMEDMSLDTTFPTDPSLSPDEISDLQTTDDGRSRAGRGLDFNVRGCKNFKCELKRKELELQIDTLNAQLSEKLLLIDNTKAQHMQKVGDSVVKLYLGVCRVTAFSTNLQNNGPKVLLSDNGI